MSSWQTLSKVQYLMSHTPADDRVGRYISGPDFEMSESRQPAASPASPATPTPTVGTSVPAPADVELTASESGRPVGKRFILAGKAIVTLVGRDSRYTFQVTRKEPEAGSRFVDPAYFVALLTGPDNTSDYTYVGMLDVSTGSIKLTKKSRYTDSSAPVMAWNWTIRRVWAGKAIEPAKMIHAGRCGRCGRLLTMPASVESGFGPECLGKLEGGE